MNLKDMLKKAFNITTPEESCKKYLLDNGIKVGKNTSIFSWSSIDAGKPWLIEIGNNCVIAPNVTILTHDASPSVFGCGTKLGKVKIGNNVFIGTRSVVLCDTHIGNNVVVGAGSVVTRDLESDGVYAGSPAKYICSTKDYINRVKKQRNERPDFSNIRPWNTWNEATEEEKQLMYDQLEDGHGYF